MAITVEIYFKGVWNEESYSKLTKSKCIQKSIINLFGVAGVWSKHDDFFENVNCCSCGGYESFSLHEKEGVFLCHVGVRWKVFKDDDSIKSAVVELAENVAACFGGFDFIVASDQEVVNNSSLSDHFFEGTFKELLYDDLVYKH